MPMWPDSQILNYEVGEISKGSDSDKGVRISRFDGVFLLSTNYFQMCLKYMNAIQMEKQGPF